jgi:nitrate reductase gamma subunit
MTRDRSVPSQRTPGLTMAALVIAGAVMILTGASIVGLELAAPAGGGVALTPSSVPTLAIALVTIVAGVECIRRRHFLIAIVVPALFAWGDLAYGLAYGQMGSFMAGAILMLMVMLIASSRSAFQD